MGPIKLLGMVAAFLVGVVAGTILEKKSFPDIDVHQLELQRYNMAEYFYGNPMNFSFETPHLARNLYFSSSHGICWVGFHNGTVALSFMLDPLTDDMPQILLVLYTNFVLAMYLMNDSCVPNVNYIDLHQALAGYELSNPSSIFAYYSSESVFYVIIDTLAKGPNRKSSSHFVEVKWNSSGPIVQGLAPSGDLANATLLVYQDMLFAFHKCVDRETCSRVPAKNAVYGYLLREGRMVSDMDPYLIAKLDDEFFGKTGVMIREIVVYNNSLLICDIGNNMIYQVRMSAGDRLPSLRRHFTFLSRAESIAVSSWTATFYVAARLSDQNNAEVLKVQDNNLEDIYYDYSREKQGGYRLETGNYRIAKTCETKRFHFSLIYNARNVSEQYIRAVSFANKYVDVFPVSNVLLLDCYLYQYDYILTVRPNGYHLFKHKFPELLVNFTVPQSGLIPNGNFLSETFTFIVRSSSETLKITRNLHLFPANSIVPSAKIPINSSLPLYNYKGMTVTLDLSQAYGGLVNNITISAREPVRPLISLESKWEAFALINLKQMGKYELIVNSTREKSLLLSHRNSRVYAFPFTPEVISGKEALKVFCFQVNSVGKINVLAECAVGDMGEELIPPAPIVGPIVQVSEMYYAAIQRNSYDRRCYLDLYQYDPSQKKEARILRKIVTEAFSPEDEILSLIYNPAGKPKTLIVYGNRDNKGFFHVFGVQSEPGKFSLKYRGKYTTTSRILKGAFLPDCNVAVFLCSGNDHRYLLMRPFLEVKMSTDVIPIKENVADFLTYGNYIIAVTVEGGVFQYSVDYPELIYVRAIPLPENSLVVMRKGKAIINIDSEMTGSRLFIYLLVKASVEGKKDQFGIYVFDILDITRNAPYLAIDIDPQLIQPVVTEIYDLVVTKYEGGHSLLLFVTNQFIMPVLFRDHMSLKFTSEYPGAFSNERVIIHPASDEKLYLALNFTEIDTPFTAYQKERNDSIVTLPTNITLDLDNYVKGYELAPEILNSSSCVADLVDDFCLLQEIPGTYSNGSFYLIISNEKLYVYTNKDMVYAYDLNYESPVGEIVPPPRAIYNLHRYFVPNTIRVLYTNGEYYYGLIGFEEQGGLIKLSIFNKSRAIYEDNINYGNGAMLLNGNRLGVFVYIHPLKNSFYGRVLNVTKSEVFTYEFNSFDLGCEVGDGFDCTISKIYPLLYCVNSAGEIYTVALEGERARFLGVTSIRDAFNKQFAMVSLAKELEHVGLVSTYNSELYIFIAMGVIRCKAYFTPTPAINCSRDKGTPVLNIIPNYLNYSTENIWASDGKVFAVLIANHASPKKYAIRFMDVLGPFDSTEIRDLPLSDGENVSSLAVNGTAFGNTGVVLIQYLGGGLKVLNFSFHQLVTIQAGPTHCILDLVSTNVLKEDIRIRITVETLQMKPINIALVFGCLQCSLGFVVIMLLVRHYYVQKSMPRKRSEHEIIKESSDNLSADSAFSAEDRWVEEVLESGSKLRRIASDEAVERLNINEAESFVTVTEEKKD